MKVLLCSSPNSLPPLKKVYAQKIDCSLFCEGFSGENFLKKLQESLIAENCRLFPLQVMWRCIWGKIGSFHFVAHSYYVTGSPIKSRETWAATEWLQQDTNRVQVPDFSGYVYTYKLRNQKG